MKSNRTDLTDLEPSESQLYNMQPDLSDYVAQLENDINQLNNQVLQGQKHLVSPARFEDNNILIQDNNGPSPPKMLQNRLLQSISTEQGESASDFSPVKNIFPAKQSMGTARFPDSQTPNRYDLPFQFQNLHMSQSSTGTPLRLLPQESNSNSVQLLEKKIAIYEQEKSRIFQDMERDKKSWINLQEIMKQENLTLQKKVKKYREVIEKQKIQISESQEENQKLKAENVRQQTVIKSYKMQIKQIKREEKMIVVVPKQRENSTRNRSQTSQVRSQRSFSGLSQKTIKSHLSKKKQQTTLQARKNSGNTLDQYIERHNKAYISKPRKNVSKSRSVSVTRAQKPNHQRIKSLAQMPKRAGETSQPALSSRTPTVQKERKPSRNSQKKFHKIVSSTQSSISQIQPGALRSQKKKSGVPLRNNPMRLNTQKVDRMTQYTPAAKKSPIKAREDHSPYEKAPPLPRSKSRDASSDNSNNAQTLNICIDNQNQQIFDNNLCLSGIEEIDVFKEYQKRQSKSPISKSPLSKISKSIDTSKSRQISPQNLPKKSPLIKKSITDQEMRYNFKPQTYNEDIIPVEKFQTSQPLKFDVYSQRTVSDAFEFKSNSLGSQTQQNSASHLPSNLLEKYLQTVNKK